MHRLWHNLTAQLSTVEMPYGLMNDELEHQNIVHIKSCRYGLSIMISSGYVHIHTVLLWYSFCAPFRPPERSADREISTPHPMHVKTPELGNFSCFQDLLLALDP
jgi:hypothetical protein